MAILESCPFCGSQYVESSEVDINGWRLSAWTVMRPDLSVEQRL